jgi:hypothetical protein
MRIVGQTKQVLSMAHATYHDYQWISSAQNMLTKSPYAMEK